MILQAPDLPEAAMPHDRDGHGHAPDWQHFDSPADDDGKRYHRFYCRVCLRFIYVREWLDDDADPDE